MFRKGKGNSNSCARSLQGPRNHEGLSVQEKEKGCQILARDSFLIAHDPPLSRKCQWAQPIITQDPFIDCSANPKS